MLISFKKLKYVIIVNKIIKMKKRTAITPTRDDNFSEWYSQVVSKASLAENSPVRWCMVIKPWWYSIWENMQKILDKMFKDTWHENAYFPLLIPLSFFLKEAEHIEWFATECAVVTHHKLVKDKNWKLIPWWKLTEPLIIRPTSETIIWEVYSWWVQSYRDLPILINQWANVMRWEMRTRLFLRTSEFLWQEWHTVHSTEKEAIEETNKMLKVYEEFMKNYLAIPVIIWEKTPEEKFPWAVNTYCLEAIMQDKKALQMGTSHYLWQTFAKSTNIKFTNKDWKEEFAYTTSWGVSTRMIGWLIMIHSDDDWLVLPPKIASKHIVIIPIYNKDNESNILDYVYNLKRDLENIIFNWDNIWVIIDNSENWPWQRYWDNIRKWIPIIIEVWWKETEENSLTVSRRDENPNTKNTVTYDDFVFSISDILIDIQEKILQKAIDFRDDNIEEISDLREFKSHFSKDKPCFALCYSDKEIDKNREELLRKLKVTARCIPFEYNIDNKESKCIFTWKKIKSKIIYGRAY